LTLPLTSTRLSDRVGGIYGPQASWASTGANAFRAVIKASSSIARGESEHELLEYLQYRADRGSLVDTVGLGRMHYLGSVYPRPGGISSGAEGVGEIPRNYAKAKEYFTVVARKLWPVDWDSTGKPAGWKRLGKEALDTVRDPAAIAAGFLGRMALRGEGGKPDYKRARLWLDRAAELVRLVLDPAHIMPIM
jgi:SEL1 protein